MNPLPRGLLITSIILCSLLTQTETAPAQVASTEVEIKSIDPAGRTITVIRDGKTEQFDLSRKTSVTVAGKDADVTAILPGDKARIEYHEELAVVTKIDAQGLGADGWRFYDVFNKGVELDQAFIVARDGSLVCPGRAEGVCLASLRELSVYTFKIEFEYPTKNNKGRPWIGIASTLPNPKGGDFRSQIPRGIEVKIHPDECGLLMLPRPDFKLQLPLGQLRDDRKVVSLRKPELKVGDWNSLEIIADEHQNITVKVNGVTVNAIAKAENMKGHIIIWPNNAEIRFRNATVTSGETETKLPFDNVLVEKN